ncbi:hypothetical protein DESC_660094 [Desulfosarcina cetonica]|nr:hypothetical protein DESC_660094 [Desulfosarcina cetonica]
MWLSPDELRSWLIPFGDMPADTKGRSRLMADGMTTQASHNR